MIKIICRSKSYLFYKSYNIWVLINFKIITSGGKYILLLTVLYPGPWCQYHCSVLRQALKLKQIELTIMSSINLPAEQYSITISDTQIRCELVCCFFFSIRSWIIKIRISFDWTYSKIKHFIWKPKIQKKYNVN